MKRGAIIGVAIMLTAPAHAYKMEVLVPPGPFHGVHGLSFGPSGELYAADLMGMTVHRVDVSSGTYRTLVGPPLGMADDVAVAPTGTPFAGTVVWTSIGVGRLYARAPDGKVRLVAENMPSINTVGFHPDGRLFATQRGGAGADALWQIDLSGRGEHRKLWDDAGGLNGFVIAKDGYLYGPQADLGRVIRLDLKSLDFKVIADDFVWPTGVKMNSRGQLFVADLEGGTVWQLDKETGDRDLLASIEPGLDNLTVGPDDKIYVSSITRNGIYELDPATKTVRAVVRGRLTAPGGIAVLDGTVPRLFLADMFSLREIDPRTGADRIIVAPAKDGLYPCNVSVFVEAGLPRALITSWFTGIMAVVDPDSGAVLRLEKGLAAPHDAVQLASGSILVAETGAKRLTLVGQDGQRRPLPMALAEPVGLTTDLAGGIFVTDATTGQVLKVDLLGERVSVVAGGFRRPEGIATMADGRLLVVDSAAQKLHRLNPANGRVETIAEAIPVGLEAPPPRPVSWIHNGVAADASGVVYLPSDRQAALYKLVPP